MNDSAIFSHQNKKVFWRQKRQVNNGDLRAAEKSGVNVLDYAYGVDLKTGSKLSVYPTLMGDILDQQQNGGQNQFNGGQNQFDQFGSGQNDHNQLGILRPQDSGSDNFQSAYAKVNTIFKVTNCKICLWPLIIFTPILAKTNFCNKFKIGHESAINLRGLIQFSKKSYSCAYFALNSYFLEGERPSQIKSGLHSRSYNHPSSHFHESGST